MSTLRHGDPPSEEAGVSATRSDDPTSLVALVYRLVKDPGCTFGAVAILCPVSAAVVSIAEPSMTVVDALVTPLGAAASIGLLLAGVRWLRARQGRRSTADSDNPKNNAG